MVEKYIRALYRALILVILFHFCIGAIYYFYYYYFDYYYYFHFSRLLSFSIALFYVVLYLPIYYYITKGV